MSETIGSAGKDRYDAIVADTRELITQRTRIQFRIGDLALEIEPMRRHGGASGSDAIFGTLVSQVLARFAEDVGVSASSVNRWRWGRVALAGSVPP